MFPVRIIYSSFDIAAVIQHQACSVVEEENEDTLLEEELASQYPARNRFQSFSVSELWSEVDNTVCASLRCCGVSSTVRERVLVCLLGIKKQHGTESSVLPARPATN